jgi:hypothetical protein
MAKARIALAASFERNLETMRLFLEDSGAAANVFDGVVKAIVERLFPLLESHPRVGRDWLLSRPATDSGKLLRQRVVEKLGSSRELREVVLDDLLVLYAVDANTLTLLAVRHHRQMGYDLR